MPEEHSVLILDVTEDELPLLSMVCELYEVIPDRIRIYTETPTK